MPSTVFKSWTSRALTLAVSLAVGGCKGESPACCTGPITPPPPPIVVGAPTAVFVSAASANAFDPVTFDAAGSTSSDGSALQYAWDFGNGQRGGGKTITRSFGTGGTRTITLTVFDGANRSASVTKAIAIAAPPAPVATLSVQGSVKMLDGTALQGVVIAQVGGTASATTDTAGNARLSLGAGTPLTVRFSKAGYADQVLAVTLPATTGSDAAFEVVMRTRDAALTLADAAAGGSLSGRDGAQLALPPNALVTAAGTAVTGAVQIAITPVDVTQNGGGGFPGSFSGLAQNGMATPIVSFGTTEYVLTAGGQPVQVAPGKTATIELPLYATKRLSGALLAVGDTTPLWSLDETTGGWVQEGSGTVVASTNSPSGLALRASVTHFSWWNSDIGFDPYGPQPKCAYDTDSGVPGGNDTFATATICNMLAQIDSSAGGPAPRATKGPSLIAAAALPPRIAGFARRLTIPIAGGVTIPVPANLNVLLKATALNGTWGGTLVVNGGVGVQAQALIKMRPLFAVAGTTPEAITLPFDGTRSLAPLQPIALFTFTGATSRYARVILTPAPSSVLTGRLRLLQGTNVLATATIIGGTAQLVVPVVGMTYTIEVTGAGASAFRMQADLIGSVQTEPIALPLSLTKTIFAYGTFNGLLTVAAPMTVYLARLSDISGPSDIRLLSPTGTVLLDASGFPDAARGVTVTLPVAGVYTLEIRPRIPSLDANLRLTLDQTAWTAVAPPIVDAGTSGSLDIVDAQLDRNGKIVVFYYEVVAGGNRLKLQRWTGTAWEAVATDLLVDKPCTSYGNMMAFTFDNANAPIVINGNRTDAAATFTTVRRFTGGAWQPIGPNNGTLPLQSSFGGSCLSYPSVAVGSDNLPIAAFQFDNSVVVQRFDGTSWKGLVKPDTTGDVFALQNPTYDLKVDAAGRVWLVTGSPGFSGISARVRRFNPATPAWDTIGGALPQINTVGLLLPRLRFDAAGQPVIAWVAAVGNASVASSGAAMYRYNGSVWSTTGGFQTAGNTLAEGSNDLGFTLFGGDAYVSWTNSTPNVGRGVVVQRNTAAGWTPVGPGKGEIPQFNIGSVNDIKSSSSKVLSVGGDLYIVLVSSQPGLGGTFPSKVQLLRKVGN